MNPFARVEPGGGSLFDAAGGVGSAGGERTARDLLTGGEQQTTRDLLTGSPAPKQRAPEPADPLGALDPLGAGKVREKKKDPVFFGASAAKQVKKKD